MAHGGTCTTERALDGERGTGDADASGFAPRSTLRERTSGDRLAGRFELLRTLGEGGYGVVYEAVDLEWSTRVALKTLQRMDPDALLRFKEEFRSLQDLEHPNLVHLGELTCFEGLWFFTMELVEGTDFFDHVRPVVERVGTLRIRRLDERRLRRALVQLVDGLIAVHQSGRVHCDIKPTNIRVEPTGRVALLDFGLVTSVASGRADAGHEGVLGTPSYMAPEQCRGEALTVAADWYAVGVVLYEALTGRLPFDGSATEVFVEKQHLVPTHPLELAPQLPRDLADACMRLLSIDPAQRPTGAWLLGLLLADNDVIPAEASGASMRPGAIDAPPFIGRATELALLDDNLVRTRSGGPTFVYVAGESGVGKTALAHAFAERAGVHADALVLRSRCYERETVPYKAFDGVVDDLARHLSRLDESRCRALLPAGAKLLVQVFPVLSRVKPIARLPKVPLPQDPNVLRSHAFAALRDILARLALERPVLLVIDDLQWADRDSLFLLDELLLAPEAPACMVLATGRPLAQLHADLAQALEPILSADIAHELRLAGLESDDAEQLVRAIAREVDDTSVFQRIAREAKGHPLFVAELVRHVEAGHAFDHGFHLDDALRGRIEQLDADTRRLLETLAVASAPTSHAVLARALSLDATDLGRRLTQLRAAHLARSEQRARAECYHDRVRRAVLDALAPEDRQRRHRALAGALSFVGDVDAEQIAYQWRSAGDLVRAARYCARAAESADRALAFNRAARLYDEALGQPRAFDEERVLALRVSHARALSCAGFSARAAEVYLRAAEGHADEEARALRRQATQLMLRSGRIGEGLELADAVLGEVGMSRPTTPTRAVARLAWERSLLAARGLSTSPQGHAPSRADAEQLELLWAVAPSLAFVDLLGGSALQSRYARKALSSGDLHHVVRSLAIEAMLRSTTEPPPQPRVETILQQVREVVGKSDSPYLRAVMWMAHGYVHWSCFRVTEAIAALVQAERLFRESCIDVAWELTNVRAGLLNALWNAGRLAQHDEHAREWRRDARERGDRYAGAQLTVIGLGYQAALGADKPDLADRVLDSALNGWPDTFQLPQWARYIGKQLVALHRGDGSAYRLLRQTWPQVRRSQLLRVPYLALLTHTDAAWACLDECTRANASERAALMAEAQHHLRVLTKTRWPLAEDLARQIQAQLQIMSGHFDEAVALLSGTVTSLSAQHSVYQHGAAYLLGRLCGGDEGRALITRAERWAREEGIVDDERWFSAFAPALRVLR